MFRKSGYSTNGPAFSNLEAIAIVDVKLCADTNLTKAMRVYIPVASACANTKPVDVWRGYSTMIWQNRGEAAKKESVNGKDYYVLETKTSVAANFASDVDATENPVFQFKAKKVDFGADTKRMKTNFKELNKEINKLNVAFDSTLEELENIDKELTKNLS